MPAQVHVFAPGSIGNIGPGLDVLGLAVGATGDEVIAERTDSRGVSIADPGHPSLPTDPSAHTSGIAALDVLRQAGARFGVRLRVRKGLPLAGGQGGSAASAVAGALAVNHLLDQPLPDTALLQAALRAESVVSGHHADNIASILMGGLVLIRSMEPLDLIRVPVPAALRIALTHPDCSMNTREARAALPAQVSREVALHQAAQVGALVAAAHSGDLALLGRAIDDRIAEPARAPLLQGFREAKAAALGAGALGCSISGSGPTVFAFADSDAAAERIGHAMAAAYAALGIRSTTRVAFPDLLGARVL